MIFRTLPPKQGRFVRICCKELMVGELSKMLDRDVAQDSDVGRPFWAASRASARLFSFCYCRVKTRLPGEAPPHTRLPICSGGASFAVCASVSDSLQLASANMVRFAG